MLNIFDPDDILISCFIKGFVAAATLFSYFYLFQFHTGIIKFIQIFNHLHLPRPLSISSLLVRSGGKTSLWCQAEIQTRICHTAGQRTTNWSTLHPTNWATLHPSNWAMLHPAEYATPCWAILDTTHYWVTLYPTELRCPPSELHCTLLSYAAPYWALPHPAELSWTLYPT